MARLLVLAALLELSLSEVDVHFTRRPESVCAPLGDKVAFDCGVSVPGGRLAWRWRVEGGAWLDVNQTADTAFRISAPRSTTSRLTVQLLDAGKAAEYRCIAWYGGMTIASVPGRLSIAQLDTTKLGQGEDRVIYAPTKNTLSLRCPAPPSEPPASLSYWKVNGNSGSHTNGYGSGEMLPVTDGALVIPNATVADSGIYACSALNELSGQIVTLPWRIVLQVSDEETGQAPRLLSWDLSGGERVVRAPVGGIARVRCGAIGSPPPRVTWTRDGAAVPAQAVRDALQQTLTINGLRAEDEGVYRCLASNVHGSVRGAWRVLAARGATWGRPPAHAEPAPEGGVASVACQRPDGEPAPRVEWLLNAETVDNDTNIRIADGILTINPVEKRHAGIVQCVASNEFGSDYGAVLLSVVPKQISGQESGVPGELGAGGMSSGGRGNDRPKYRNRKQQRKHKAVMVPPSSPNVTRLHERGVMVRWSVAPNAGLPIQFFKVQYKDVSRRQAARWQTTNHDIAPHVHSYEVDGLETDHTYVFRIAAAYSNNDNKQGKNSAPFHLQRVAPRPPPAPLLLRAVPTSPTTMRLHWNFTNSGPAVEGFYAYYRAASSAGEYGKLTVDGQGSRHADLTHLAPDTPYELKLQSFTAGAASDFSDILVQRSMKLAKSSDGGAPPPPLPPPTPRWSAQALAGAAGGGAALLGAVLLTLLLCRRKKPDNKDTTKCAVTEDRRDRDRSADERPTSNGYVLSHKLPITITDNPLHQQASDVAVEMSYMTAHNNNCSPTNHSPRSRRGSSPAPPPPSRRGSSPPPLSCKGSLTRSVTSNASPIIVGAGHNYV